MADPPQWDALTQKIIGCAFHVSNELGCGFLEKVYENALVVALQKTGLRVHQQARYKVFYQGVQADEYVTDLVVEGTVQLEPKSVKALDEIHAAQSINLLHASKLPICLLFNFAKPRLEFRRYVGKFAREDMEEKEPPMNTDEHR